MKDELPKALKTYEKLLKATKAMQTRLPKSRKVLK